MAKKKKETTEEAQARIKALAAHCCKRAVAKRASWLVREEQYLRKIYSRIMGFKLIALEIEEVDGQLYPCLIFENNAGERNIAIVYQDPEGNGPGSIKIISDDDVNHDDMTEGGLDEFHVDDTGAN